MSASIVSKAHIDYLITAGLRLPRRGLAGSKLRWMAPGQERDTDRQRGNPWGPTWTETLLQRTRELTEETADRTGAMLILENVRSVSFRYAGSVVEVDGIASGQTDERGRRLPGPNDPYYTRPYVYPKADVIRRRIDPVEALARLDCYEYQACEHPGWEASEAKAFCDSLRSAAIHALPGYADAGWEVRE